MPPCASIAIAVCYTSRKGSLSQLVDRAFMHTSADSLLVELLQRLLGAQRLSTFLNWDVSKADMSNNS